VDAKSRRPTIPPVSVFNRRAQIPELPGYASAGDTEAEAIANAKEALALWFEPD